MICEIIISKECSAEESMAVDQKLLESLASSPRCLMHFYRWKGLWATYGYFIDPFDYLNRREVEAYNLRLARRPTGGGILFHHCDLAFSVLVPAAHSGYSTNTLENYALVNDAVMLAVQQFLGEMPNLLAEEPVPPDLPSRNFCMAKPTKYDVMLQGRKVGGGAQRRTKHGFLHQGTISMTSPADSFLDAVLLPGTCVAESMRRNSFSLLRTGGAPDLLEEGRAKMRLLLLDAFGAVIWKKKNPYRG